MCVHPHTWHFHFESWAEAQSFSNISFTIGQLFSGSHLFTISPLSFWPCPGDVISGLSLERNLNVSLLGFSLFGYPPWAAGSILHPHLSGLTSLISGVWENCKWLLHFIIFVSTMKMFNAWYLRLFICLSWVWHTECSSSTLILREIALSHSWLIQQLNFIKVQQ